MTKRSAAAAKPAIIVTDIDHKRLSGLAASAIDRFPEVAEELQIEMERAKVVRERALPSGVIQMGSTVEYRSDLDELRRVTLVFPNDADIAQGKVSILTPIGTALIGLSIGQSIRWVARDGREHELTVTAVEQPAMAEPKAS